MGGYTLIFGAFLRDMAKKSLFCGWKEKTSLSEEGGWNSVGTFFGLKVRVWLLNGMDVNSLM